MQTKLIVAQQDCERIRGGATTAQKKEKQNINKKIYCRVIVWTVVRKTEWSLKCWRLSAAGDSHLPAPRYIFKYLPSEPQSCVCDSVW